MPEFIGGSSCKGGKNTGPDCIGRWLCSDNGGGAMFGSPPTLSGDGVCRPRVLGAKAGGLGPRLGLFMGEFMRGVGGVGGPPL